MASAKPRSALVKQAVQSPPKSPAGASEPLAQVLLNMVIGIVAVALMALAVIGMIRMLGDAT